MPGERWRLPLCTQQYSLNYYSSKARVEYNSIISNNMRRVSAVQTSLLTLINRNIKTVIEGSEVN